MLKKWQVEEFLEKLEGPEGCAFKEEIPGDSDSVTWNCKGGIDQSLSIAILDKMNIPKNEQIEFLKLCTSHGGHCDCEILFNAAEHLF